MIIIRAATRPTERFEDRFTHDNGMEMGTGKCWLNVYRNEISAKERRRQIMCKFMSTKTSELSYTRTTD